MLWIALALTLSTATCGPWIAPPGPGGAPCQPAGAFAACLPGTYQRCETSAEGCYQCSCVPADARGLAPGPPTPASR